MDTKFRRLIIAVPLVVWAQIHNEMIHDASHFDLEPERAPHQTPLVLTKASSGTSTSTGIAQYRSPAARA